MAKKKQPFRCLDCGHEFWSQKDLEHVQCGECGGRYCELLPSGETPAPKTIQRYKTLNESLLASGRLRRKAVESYLSMIDDVTAMEALVVRSSDLGDESKAEDFKRDFTEAAHKAYESMVRFSLYSKTLNPAKGGVDIKDVASLFGGSQPHEPEAKTTSI